MPGCCARQLRCELVVSWCGDVYGFERCGLFAGLSSLLLSSASLSFFWETVNVTSVMGDPLPSKAKCGSDRTTIVILLHSRFYRCRTRLRAEKHPARCRPFTSGSSSGQERSPAPKSKLIVIEANAHCMDGASDGLGEMAVDTHCCCCCRCLAQRAVVRPSRRACTVYAVATQTKTVKIGTRGSPLALAQAYLTRDLLKVGAAGNQSCAHKGLQAACAPVSGAYEDLDGVGMQLNGACVATDVQLHRCCQGRGWLLLPANRRAPSRVRIAGTPLQHQHI